MPVRRLVLLLLLVPALGACTIALPYRDLSGGRAPESPTRVVALTYAVLDAAKRAPFDRGSAEVMRSLPQQPGIVGYRLRREIFGDAVWTMTVWESDAAWAAFVRSPVHLAAIREGSGAIRQGRFAHVEVPASETPLSWKRALEVLESEAGRY